MNAKPFLPLLLLAGACTSAPQIVREPHPDQNAYRSREEIETWQKIDSIPTFKTELIEAGIAAE